MRIAAILALGALAMASSGCTHGFFVTQIAATPNHGREIEMTACADQRECERMGADGFVRVEVGPPIASIGLWLFEPASKPRGTVFVLHGVADGPFWMRDKARAFAAHGYRAVLVGLRGYGASTGDFRGYGVFERHDLSQVVDELERLGLIDGSIGVWGMSYGGAVAHLWGASDPRVCAVVTVGAFSSMRLVVPQVMRLMFPIPALFASDEECQSIIDEASGFAGFDPDEACPEAAVAGTSAATLLIHGDWDLIVPYEHAERLHAAAPIGTTLLRLPATGHLGSYIDFGGRVEAASLEWFDRWLARKAP